MGGRYETPRMREPEFIVPPALVDYIGPAQSAVPHKCVFHAQSSNGIARLGGVLPTPSDDQSPTFTNNVLHPPDT